jgi:hypothetical protein
MRFDLAVVGALLCVGCTITAGDVKTSDFAPTPFTAQQIRAATHPGRTYRYRLTEGTGAPVVRVMRFADAGPERAQLESYVEGPDGAPTAPPRTSNPTWQELVEHARYPQAQTAITDARVEVEAGVWDALLYTVRTVEEGADVVTRAWFAVTLPGAPVLMEIERDGVRVMRMELVSHDAGISRVR